MLQEGPKKWQKDKKKKEKEKKKEKYIDVGKKRHLNRGEQQDD